MQAASECFSMYPNSFFLFGRSLFHEETAKLTMCIPAFMKKKKSGYQNEGKKQRVKMNYHALIR